MREPGDEQHLAGTTAADHRQTSAGRRDPSGPARKPLKNRSWRAGRRHERPTVQRGRRRAARDGRRRPRRPADQGQDPTASPASPSRPTGRRARTPPPRTAARPRRRRSRFSTSPVASRLHGGRRCTRRRRTGRRGRRGRPAGRYPAWNRRAVRRRGSTSGRRTSQANSSDVFDAQATACWRGPGGFDQVMRKSGHSSHVVESGRSAMLCWPSFGFI